MRDAATKLEVSQATVYNLVAAGRLRCIRVGMGRGTIRILETHIEEFLAGAEPVIQQAPLPIHVKLKHLRL